MTLALLLAFLGMTTVLTAMFRFPKSVLIPLGGLLLLFLATAIWSLRDFHVLNNDRSLVEVRIVAERPSQRSWEVQFTADGHGPPLTRHDSSDTQWPVESVLVVTFPIGTQEPLRIFSWKPKNKLDLGQQTLWFLTDKLGWAKSKAIMPPRNAQKFYVYRLISQEGEFSWETAIPNDALTR